MTAFDAKTGKILWRAYTLPGPGEFGSETWPAASEAAIPRGAPIWNTPALDPQLGLIYFVERTRSRGRERVSRSARFRPGNAH